jgi:hypothetical protein
VVDARAEEGHLLERDLDQLGEAACRVLDGVAEPDNAVDG